MMISPLSYIEEKKDWKLDKLYKEKQQLEKYISDFIQGKIPEEKYAINPSPEVVASVYEDYLIELNNLIERKERENKTEKKYIELKEYNKIENFLKENDFFDGAELYKIYNKDGNAEVFINDGEQELEIYLYNVKEFNMSFYAGTTYIDCIDVNEIDGLISLGIDEDSIFITAESIKLKALDWEKTIYTYASVKYKEDQDKTFYYISNIEDLKEGDYVYVPVRDTYCPAIVERIDKFPYRDVPFPTSRTKTIIRRSSKEEFEKFKQKGEEGFKHDYDLCDYIDEFQFEDYNTIHERAKKLPFIKSHKVEWSETEENEDGSITIPVPLYNDEVRNWIHAFYDLKLLDKNYLDNCEYIKEKNIFELNFNEILSYFTFIIRGDRFCDGHIASFLEDGTIELLEKRLAIMCNDFIELDNINVNEFEEKDIMYFTLAESGAMGEPDGIEVITKKDGNIKLYHTSARCFVVPEINDKFKMIHKLNCGLFGAVTNVPEGFIHVDTGFGNHLFINKTISEKLLDKIQGLQTYEIYSRWLLFGLDILDFNWNSWNK